MQTNFIQMYFSIDKKFSGFITLIPKTFSWKLDLCLSSFKRNSLLEVQGISFLNWIFKLALRDRRTSIFFDLWCLVASGGADICVSSTSFQKKWLRLASAASDRKGAKTKHDISWFYPPKNLFKKKKIKLNSNVWMTLKSSVVILQA